jgi:hypothetical protein
VLCSYRELTALKKTHKDPLRTLRLWSKTELLPGPSSSRAHSDDESSMATGVYCTAEQAAKVASRAAKGPLKHKRNI